MLRYGVAIWAVTLAIAMSVPFAYSLLVAEPSVGKTLFLPGETTHGHYQIELKCSACHVAGGGVNNDSCRDCHQALKEYDTHPAKKFRDPTNAHRLEKIDARECVTCHREHEPHNTSEMGVTLPTNYCVYCHDEIAKSRPSHAKFEFNTCTASGCHNYHDNTALYEDFLFKHVGEPDVLDDPHVPPLTHDVDPAKRVSEPDAPQQVKFNETLASDWRETAHAASGVNCNGCHQQKLDDVQGPQWHDQVAIETCEKCHQNEHDGFVQGMHGMRLAVGLPPMTVGAARLPMKADAAHRQLSCVSCHDDHRFDTRYAAVDACLKCHDDQHSLAYKSSSHYELWLAEEAGAAAAGTGVSCATCHMPRVEKDRKVVVEHNQNATLQPSEGMVRTACMNCHGLQFSLDSLADPQQIPNCFATKPSVHVESLEMAKEWFEAKEREKEARKKK
ncbi:ammonia-forming cytochrome c nitrite reductase subunit c552 [Blastopirellula sp. JC732]|uniref:nitrite reductase (cytochrome; ammonia-forming) n=1 Tax=Blastopirellula sediminis TaxID=2894196 RepID=A0A9X1SMF4_9BACT|nr:ammonia-forming cytochrome c nitrite reductase subunit c552 [Blastopirellula sediminis]MCC9605081.1 ammonia-forming cytochrome c nitrite reductase subunit c552 [Blastopirellula sediminis]MCC9631619.1 ammonia-forming cytochrome c nitrite reductase subunit c552 [Blastopirellula sediminis]